MIGNMSLVEFLGGSFLIIFSFWSSLYIGMDVLILGILLELYLYIHSRVFISSCCSVLAFSFSYIENEKLLGILHWLAFWSLESLSFILAHVKKDCILFRIIELNWELHYWKAYHLLEIEVRTLHCIHIHLFYLLSHNITSFTTAPFE